MKTVLVTGCSSGFGRGLVSEFLRRGWTVAATLRSAGTRRSIFDEDAGLAPERLHVVPLDVADAAQRRAAADFAREKFGRLDCLVNNAGYGLFGAAEDAGEEQFRRIMEVNFFGAVFLTRELLPLLRRSKGRIINISSVLGYLGIPMAAAYCASKFALEGFTESLSHELKSHGVQVALVEPGRFSTQFGDNAAWGEGCGAAGSAYAAQTANYRRNKEKADRSKRVPSGRVVWTTVDLAEMRRMPLRTRCGLDAAAVHYLCKALPQELLTRMISGYFDRMLRAPAPPPSHGPA